YDLIDLGWHQNEFQTRLSFAYTVVTLSESQVIGCVYIDPTRGFDFDAEVSLWARQSALAGGFEARLYSTVRQWLQTDWPLEEGCVPRQGHRLARLACSPARDTLKALRPRKIVGRGSTRRAG